MDGNLCVRLVLSLRAQFGQAAFLLLYFMGCAPLDWSADVPAYVADGRVISDASLAERLNVKPRRLSAWRKKLRDAGKLDWTLSFKLQQSWYGADNYSCENDSSLARPTTHACCSGGRPRARAKRKTRL